MDIRGRYIVLTGASGGIGRAIAAALSGEGARLLLVGRNEQKLSNSLAGLAGDGHITVAADLSTDAGRGRVLAACQQLAPQGVSILINGAGINEFSLFETLSAARARELVDVNLLSPMLLTQDLLPLLQEQQDARVINIGSTFGSIGYPGFSAYCASKFGLRGFTEALRRELADTGTRVSYIAPRATRTDLNTDTVVAMNDELGTAMDDPSQVASEVLAAIHGSARTDKFIGWPEKFFVRINALLPAVVDSSLRKQLPIIRRFARNQT